VCVGASTLRAKVRAGLNWSHRYARLHDKRNRCQTFSNGDHISHSSGKGHVIFSTSHCKICACRRTFKALSFGPPPPDQIVRCVKGFGRSFAARSPRSCVRLGFWFGTRQLGVGSWYD
jgi:hypothetical protein